MSTPEGWRPLQTPRRPPGSGYLVSPFTKLARTHAVSVAGDAMVALALAGSLFFSLDPTQARPKVALYLVLTFAPFAVVAPLIGPAIDRMAGGRKAMVVLAAAIRAVLCVVMAFHIDSLLLFPLAFGTMVAAKGYQVAKSALVPAVVNDHSELVEANSKLQLISGVGGAAGFVPALPLAWLLGSEAVMVLAAVVFAVAAALGLRLPATRVAATRAGPAEVAELRGTAIVLGAGAISLMRGTVGFLMFHIAFFFRNDDAPTWWFGLAISASTVGGVLGAAAAPVVRRHAREELMIIQVLAVSCAMGALAAWGGGRWSAALLAATIGLSAAFAKLAFDSIVQRDAPDANQGRSFATFETRFQLSWVIGAFLPVVITIPGWVGFLIVSLVSGFAAASYLWGLRYLRATGHMPPTMRQVLAARGLVPRRNAPGDATPSWLRSRIRTGARPGQPRAGAAPGPVTSPAAGMAPGNEPGGPVSQPRGALAGLLGRRRGGPADGDGGPWHAPGAGPQPPPPPPVLDPPSLPPPPPVLPPPSEQAPR